MKPAIMEKLTLYRAMTLLTEAVILHGIVLAVMQGA